MALQQKIIPGSLIVRRSGGVAGTDELQIHHNGTNAILAPALGSLIVDSALKVTGATTLATSLNGILKTVSGLVSGTAALDDLGDVIITAPTRNDVITFDGTNFVNTPVFKESDIVVDSFVGTGSQTVFILSKAAINEESLDITIGGVHIAAADYTVNGTTLTFTSAPPVAAIQVKHLSSASIVVDSFTGNGTQVTFNLSVPAASTEALDVSVGGFILLPTDYTVNGTTLTFTSAPPAAPINVKNLIGVDYTTIDLFTGNGTQVTFNLSIPAFSVESLSIIVGDVYVETADYTVNGTTLTFTSAPPAAPLQVKHLSDIYVLGTGAVKLVNLANGIPGNLISYDANGTAVAVSTGTAGQVLKSNGPGLAPTMQDTKIGWTIKESGSFTNVSTLDFIGLSKTTKFILTNVTNSVITDVRLLTSSNNGTSYDSSTGNYQYKLADVGDSELQQSTTDPYIICTAEQAITIAGYASTFEITIYAPEKTNVTLLDISSLIFSSTTEIESWSGYAARMVAAIVDALKFYPGAGGTFSGDYTVLELN